MKRDSSKTRSIWIEYHGPIPSDSQNRSYDIHHIDGDYTNDSIENLKAVSLEEHWNIHFDQGDYAAANLIADRMNKEYYSGWQHSDEVKKKIGESNKKHTGERIWINDGISEKIIKIDDDIPIGFKRGRLSLSDEAKKALRLANLGKKQSEETKRKRSISNTGKIRSEETKDKIKKSWTTERKKQNAEFISLTRTGQNNPNFGKNPWNKGFKK